MLWQEDVFFFWHGRGGIGTVIGKSENRQAAVDLNWFLMAFHIEHQPPTKSTNAPLARMLHNAVCPHCHNARGYLGFVVFRPWHVHVQILRPVHRGAAAKRRQQQETGDGGGFDDLAYVGHFEVLGYGLWAMGYGLWAMDIDHCTFLILSSF
ncbi:MAG: hypothetical protein U9N87_15025 [Planctomycetota bacterium]|nr:hypothetical protein [Planctomycetota bacterium]